MTILRDHTEPKPPRMISPILIDCRERGAEYIEHLQTTLPVEAKFLDAGDIVVHDLGIERKTISDFFMTLEEGNLFTQLRQLKRSFIRQLLLIEGRGMRFHLDNYPLMALYIRICAGWQIPILHTRDGEHTASVIRQIAFQDLRESAGPMRSRPRNPAYKIKEPALRIVTSIPGIGIKRAQALIEHFDNVSAILGATEPQLLHVPGIGPTHAASIMAANEPYIKTIRVELSD